jgi:hypothetical protein
MFYDRHKVAISYKTRKKQQQNFLKLLIGVRAINYQAEQDASVCSAGNEAIALSGWKPV